MIVQTAPMSLRPAGLKTFADERWEQAVAEIARIEHQKEAPGATAKQRQGVGAIGKSHRMWLLKLAGVKAPGSSKAQVAVLHEILERSGGTSAALPCA